MVKGRKTMAPAKRRTCTRTFDRTACQSRHRREKPVVAEGKIRYASSWANPVMSMWARVVSVDVP